MHATRKQPPEASEAEGQRREGGGSVTRACDGTAADASARSLPQAQTSFTR